jgi:hypothetical protein
MANFRISFSKAIDQRTPTEQLVYRAYMSDLNNLTTRDGIEQAVMVGQKFDATFFDVFIESPKYIQIVVFNNYGSIRFYKPRFINPVEELDPIDFEINLINQNQILSGDMVVLTPDSDVIVGLRNAPQVISGEFEAQDLEDMNIDTDIINDPQIIESTVRNDGVAPTKIPVIENINVDEPIVTVTRSEDIAAAYYEAELSKTDFLEIINVELNNPFTFEDLDDGFYSIRVRSVNNAGESNWSDSESFQFGEAVLTMPTDTSLTTSIEGNDATIGWNEASYDQPITYKVYSLDEDFAIEFEPPLTLETLEDVDAHGEFEGEVIDLTELIITPGIGNFEIVVVAESGGQREIYQPTNITIDATEVTLVSFVDPKTEYVEVGEEIQLHITIQATGGASEEVTFHTLDSTVATIEADGTDPSIGIPDFISQGVAQFEVRSVFDPTIKDTISFEVVEATGESETNQFST